MSGLFACAAAFAAPQTNQQPRIVNAFYAWQDVVLADLTANTPADIVPATPISTEITTNDAAVEKTKQKAKEKEKADKNAKQKAKRDLHKKSAVLAKSFYSTYPNDPNAPKARKIEALAALRGIDDEDPVSAAAGNVVADAFRADKKNSANDRFDVAWLQERRKLAQSAKTNPAANGKPEIEKLVDKLRIECDDAAGAYAIYGDLLRRANMDDASKLATKLLALKGTPDYLKTQAQAESARAKLKGSKATLSLTTIDNRALSTATGKGNYTLLYICGPTDKLAVYSNAAAKNVQWVQVFADDTGKFDPKSAKALETGVATVYDSKGKDGSICKALGVTSIPYVVILDGSQKIYSYGPPEFLPELLKEVAK